MADDHWAPGAVPIRYPDPNIQVLDPRFAQYVLPMAAIEWIAGGCRFTEGPVWFGDGRYLLWSDIPNAPSPSTAAPRTMPTATPATGRGGSSPARWAASG